MQLTEIPDDWVMYLKWNYVNQQYGFLIEWSQMALFKKHYESYINEHHDNKTSATFDWHFNAKKRRYIGKLLLIEKLFFHSKSDKITYHICQHEYSRQQPKYVYHQQYSIEDHPATVKPCHFFIFLSYSLNSIIDYTYKFDVNLSHIKDWKHFDLKQYPLRSYLSTIQIKPYSFTKTIQYRSDLLLHGFVSNNVFPQDLTGICAAYFIGNYPSRIYDDTLSKLNDIERNQLIQNAFNILCPYNDLKLSHSLKYIIDVLKKWENTNHNCSHSCHNDEDRICKLFYYRTVYLSHLLSLTEITYFYEALSFQQKTGLIVDITIGKDQLIESANVIHNRYSKYGTIGNIYTFSDGEEDRKRHGYVGNDAEERVRRFIVYNQHRNIYIRIDVDVNYISLCFILALSQQTNEYHFREGIQLVYRLLRENDKFYTFHEAFCKIDHDAEWSRRNTYGFLQDKRYMELMAWYFDGTVIEPMYVRKLFFPIVNNQESHIESIFSVLRSQNVAFDKLCRETIGSTKTNWKSLKF
eukprot:235005_1